MTISHDTTEEESMNAQHSEADWDRLEVNEACITNWARDFVDDVDIPATLDRLRECARALVTAPLSDDETTVRDLAQAVEDICYTNNANWVLLNHSPRHDRGGDATCPATVTAVPPHRSCDPHGERG